MEISSLLSSKFAKFTVPLTQHVLLMLHVVSLNTTC